MVLGLLLLRFWYLLTGLLPTLQLLPEQERVTLWPKAPDTEGGCVNTDNPQDPGKDRDTESVMLGS